MSSRFLPNLLWALICFAAYEGCSNKESEEFEPPVLNNSEIPDVEMYTTLANATQKLANQAASISVFDENNLVIEISKEEKFQTMDGFGFALTGGSASHLNSMTSSKRNDLLNELFGQSPEGIGLSFIRISIGASDLDAQVFSYSDTPDNIPDIDLTSFSIDRDREFLIPILKEILAINPNIKIMASPWSPPAWMKSNKSMKGGSLLVEYYECYANYFVKYLDSMKNEGINIDFISIQNEPLHDGNNPSLYMTSSEQASFIKNHLGPVFENENISTKILIYDHNPDRTDYPIAILDDPNAKKYVYGSAFHLYGGQIASISGVHSKHPDKHIYFTEQWYGAPGNFSGDLKWHIREVVIGSIRNWSKGVIEWNLSSNPQLEPHTEGGCDQCLGAITIDGDNVIRNAGYYVLGHISKFVPPGSQRIESTYNSGLPNVAFITPENKIVVLVLNNLDTGQSFSITGGETEFSSYLDAGSVATFTWMVE